MFFARFRLACLATAGVTVGSLACGDSLGLPAAAFENVVDTTTLFALQQTSISSPSAYDMVARTTSRTDLGLPFDLAFDLDREGRALLYPASALGIPNAAAVQLTSRAFDQIERAPVEGYRADSAVVVDPGVVLIARSRAEGVFCGFLGAIPRFGKFHVLTVDRDARSVTMELLVNINCGYRSLATGLPAN